jgi:hypothetical protein
MVGGEFCAPEQIPGQINGNPAIVIPAQAGIQTRPPASTTTLSIPVIPAQAGIQTFAHRLPKVRKMVGGEYCAPSRVAEEFVAHGSVLFRSEKLMPW